MALAGPTIATHGSEEVRQRFLRPMFTGEERWCLRRRLPAEGQSFGGRLGREGLDGGLHHAARVEFHVLQGELAGLDPGQVEDVVDE